MGTRSLITVESGGKEIVTIYRHWDGYPSVAGRDIWNALKDCEVVNGRRDDDDKYPNGIGRMTCHLIAKLIEAGADPDILPTGMREVGEEYHYRIYLTDKDQFDVPVGKPQLTVYSGPMTAFGWGGKDCNNIIYDGPLADFNPDMEEAA